MVKTNKHKNKCCNILKIVVDIFIKQMQLVYMFGILNFLKRERTAKCLKPKLTQILSKLGEEDTTMLTNRNEKVTLEKTSTFSVGKPRTAPETSELQIKTVPE